MDLNTLNTVGELSSAVDECMNTRAYAHTTTKDFTRFQKPSRLSTQISLNGPKNKCFYEVPTNLVFFYLNLVKCPDRNTCSLQWNGFCSCQ